MIRLFNGDCLKIMPKLPKGIITAIITDLPYAVTQNNWDVLLPFDELWWNFNRLLRPNGAVLLTASQPFTARCVMSNIKNFKCEWIWVKNRGSNFANTSHQPMKEHESVLMFGTGRGRHIYNMQMQPRSEIGQKYTAYKNNAGRVTPKCESYGKFNGPGYIRPVEFRVPSSCQKFSYDMGGFHPTQKPVKLMEYLIKTYTNKDQFVLDCCMGSGSTGVAAVNTDRNFIGIEMEERYFNVAKKRIKEAKQSKDRQEFEKTFSPYL
jgi:site-specific DNA-methyltransferase (adenine-specific)